MSLRRLVPRLLIVISITVAVLWLGFHRDQLDLSTLDDWLSRLGPWAPAAYLAIYTVGTIVFLPGSLFALVGGALFGPVLGAILNLLGATLGASVAFLAARYVASDWVTQKAAGPLKRMIDGVEPDVGPQVRDGKRRGTGESQRG